MEDDAERAALARKGRRISGAAFLIAAGLTALAYLV